ncbi:MAG: hypothetical protein LAT53_11785 [Idiomarina sp.]|nr:hypothetical protein [Idiomarina sp.]
MAIRRKQIKKVSPTHSVDDYSILLNEGLKNIEDLLEQNTSIVSEDDAKKLRDIAISSEKKQKLTLLLINESKAYKLLGYKSFGTFVEENLNIGKTNASKMVSAARIAKKYFGVEYINLLTTDSLLPLLKLSEQEILDVVEHLKDVNKTDTLKKKHVTKQSVEAAINSIKDLEGSESQKAEKKASNQFKFTATFHTEEQKRAEKLKKFIDAYASQTTKSSNKALTLALISVLPEQVLISANTLISEIIYERISDDVDDLIKVIKETVS